MFDGVPAEQLHQLIASSRTSLPLPLPLPLPLSSFPSPPPNNNINTFHVPPAAPFDPYNTSKNPSHLHHHQLLQIQPHQLHQNHQLLQLHHQSTATPKNLEEKEEHSSTVSISINNNLEIERERSSSIPASSDVPIISDYWSNDELLALLRIRSTMENWFPEFTWEHVSRKLAELGFKRSAEKCKEKFEEESRYFNNIYFTKNYRFISDLEQICQGGGDAHQQNPDDHHRNPDDYQEAPGDKNNEKEKVEKPSDEGDHQDSTRNETIVGENISVINTEPLNPEERNENKVVVETRPKNNNNKKRKRQRRFEILKGFCEDIVNRMMAQQEEMHNKLLEEMVKRNEEKLAREEAWKKQEMDRKNKELEIMAREQAVAVDRQATIIKFLKKFTSSSSNSSTSTSSSLIQVQNPNRPTCRDVSGGKELDLHQEKENNPTTPSSLTEGNLAPQSPTSSTVAPTPLPVPTVTISLSATTTTAALAPTENPSSEDVIVNTQNPSSNSHDKQDLGKRWPRDEVLALINLRCSLFNNGGSGGDQDKDGGVVMKAPLWERISQGMLEMGYKRSSKRCKEKWENINKYFRKTKDDNKKRSLDSRTCPYFHQLSTLYNQGILASPSDQAPENRPASPENRALGDDDSNKHDEGEKNNNMVKQAPTPAFDFEF